MAKDRATNPSNEFQARVVTDETRIPMGLPELMLQVPQLEGYVMYWFADRPGRIPRAMSAGWEFVKREEISLNSFGYATDKMEDGNTDLGSNVSVHGGVAEKGGSERLYLMKIKQEWYDKDMALREEASEKVAKAFLSGTLGSDKESPVDTQRRYVKKADTPFTKRR